MRRFRAHWQSDARLAGVKDQSIVDRIAHMGVKGPLIVILVVDTSVHRRDTSATRSKQLAEALQNQNQFKPWNGPVKPPPIAPVNMIAPAAAKAPAAVDRSIITPLRNWSETGPSRRNSPRSWCVTPLPENSPSTPSGN
jgi:hypothetical protein